MEHLLVERLALVARAHREEHVAADELVHDFAVSSQTLEGELLARDRHLHLLDLPVDAPRVDVGEAPRLERVAALQVHQHEAVGRDAEQLLRTEKKT